MEITTLNYTQTIQNNYNTAYHYLPVRQRSLSPSPALPVPPALPNCSS